jgi:hypothetical protein
MKKHDWKLVDVKWKNGDTIFAWKCPGCGCVYEVFGPMNVGEHAAPSYMPPTRNEDCEEIMIKLIMTS